ncbi:MAG: 3'-5' exonuclease domain-containing protein 2 [Bacteroidales bacterium]|nr:3'-5' exonuclease domain-containing protein 2 [Bacteroidales bacterium]
MKMTDYNNEGFRPEVSKQELIGYDKIAFEGKIFCIDNDKDVKSAVTDLGRYTRLGFDTETRPAFKKGQKYDVSLLQLSAGNKAYLFRLNMTGLPQQVAAILANPGIAKIGVAIHDDIKALQKLRKFTPSGFIELQDMVKEYGINSAGLKKLSAIILGSTISKRQQVTNWENPTLTQAQKIYAATDAWISLQIYDKLVESSLLSGEDNL